MNSPSKDIKNLLTASGASITPTLIFGTNLFISIMPDTPDLCACIIDSSGHTPETNDSGLQYPGLQILGRGTVSGYEAAWTMMENIRDELHERTNVRQGAYYHHIVASTEIMNIGRDKKNRPLFSINFDIMRSA